jgi:hypothetical protein
MLKKLVGLVVMAGLTGGCEPDGGEVARMKAPGLPGTFIIEDAHRTTPLTAVEHLLFYEAAGERELLFHGYGGEPMRLWMLGPGSLLVSYCRGSVIELQTSFFRNPGNDLQDTGLMRLQVVTESGLSARGREIC